MNPYELPQKPERKAYHNLDASQSSSVSIKIFNKNDDNVVIRLYRNSKKGNRDRFRNSFGHPRQAAGRGGETGKSKPTMLRNLYRNTFGPTLDETVLVGMETFQLCQHNNSPNGQTFEETTTSTENLRSIIPNELSWDCSTLLPTNVNLKQYENVCTSTSNCLLDKDPNLSSLVTNHCQYCPASSDAYCQVLHDFTPSAEAIKSFTEQNQIPGHISSHENLSKHVSSDGINASYQTDITRSTLTNTIHDNNNNLASISDCSGTKDPSYVVSELEETCTESGTVVGQNMAEVSTSSCLETCVIGQEEPLLVSQSDGEQTETEIISASNLLPRSKSKLKEKQFLLGQLFKKATVTEKLKQTKSQPELLPREASQEKIYSNIKSTSYTSSFVFSTLEPTEFSFKTKQLLVFASSESEDLSNLQKKDLKVVEFSAIPLWERKKHYPTARFLSQVLKKTSRLTAGSDRPRKRLQMSCSSSSWMTHYSLRKKIRKMPSQKAREICRELQKVDNKPVLRVKHVLSTSSSSNYSTTSSTLSSNNWFPDMRQRSGTSSEQNSVIHQKLAPLESDNEANRRTTAKVRLNNSDIMLPPNDSYVQQRASTPDPFSMQQQRLTKIYNHPNEHEQPKQNSAVVQYSKETKAKMKNERRISAPKTEDHTERSQQHHRSFSIPKEEYCQSTGIIYTTDPSTAGICPDLDDVDSFDKTKSRRKPLLEKLVDVIADCSKRSNLIRNSTYCQCHSSTTYGNHKKKAPRRIPILQKIFEVFSKKSNSYPPSSSFGSFDNRNICKGNKPPKTQNDCRKNNYSELGEGRSTRKSNSNECEAKRIDGRKLRCRTTNQYTETANSDEVQKRRNSCKVEKYTETDKHNFEEIGTRRVGNCKLDCPIAKRNSKQFEDQGTGPDHACDERRKVCRNQACAAAKKYREMLQIHSEDSEKADSKNRKYSTEGKRRSSIEDFKKEKGGKCCSNTASKNEEANGTCCSCCKKSTCRKKPEPTLNLSPTNSEFYCKSVDSQPQASITDKKDKIVNYAIIVKKRHMGYRPNAQMYSALKKKIAKEIILEENNSKATDISAENKKEIKEDKATEEKEIHIKIHKSSPRPVQVKMNDIPLKIKKPLMRRSFMGDTYTPQKRATRVYKPRHSEKKKKKEENSPNCLLCNEEIQTEGKEIPTLNFVAFRDCYNENEYIEYEEATTNTRFSGGAEYEPCVRRNENEEIILNEYTYSLEKFSSGADSSVCFKYSNKDAKNRRPSTSKDRPSLSVSRKSGELDKTESDECRCTKLECCGCEKEGTSGRNKIPQETRYAITRVTKYDDYTTYEILKSTRAVPRKIPEVLEKIFIEKDK